MIQYLNPTAASSMNNGYFVAFHQGNCALIDQYEAKNLGIQEADFLQYKAKIKQINDAVLKTQGSDKTAVIAAYDEERDKLFRYVRNVLANLKYSTDAELAALYATAQAKILKVYPSSIASENNQEETAHINGFLVDVRKFFAKEISKLGISTALTALETANENFQKAFLERSDELAGIEEGATLKLRDEIEELYAKMACAINYGASRTDATDETSVSVCTFCTDFIAVHNQYSSEVKQSIKLGKALSKKESSNENGNKTDNENKTDDKPSDNPGGFADLG